MCSFIFDLRTSAHSAKQKEIQRTGENSYLHITESPYKWSVKKQMLYVSRMCSHEKEYS